MLSNKTRLFLVFALIFSVTFLMVFLAISLSLSAYSTPPVYALDVEGMGIKVGPPPNSTDIPLNTTILIDALTSVSLADFQMTPHVSIAHVDSANSGVITYLNSFYPAQPLKPATLYTVSVEIINVPLSWSFTTTAEDFNPGINFYLTTNAFLIALLTAVLVALLTTYGLGLRSKIHARKATHKTDNVHA